MVLVNGVPGAAIPASDRGLAYGDGVFRTFPVRAGQPVQWRRQYAKLAHDCAAIAIAAPDAATLGAEIARACEGAAACVVKIVITRGSGARGYRYAENVPPTRIVIAAPPPDYGADLAERGVAVRLCRLRLAQQPALAGVKHLNRLENVIARAEWKNAGVDEGVLCDAEGRVVGGTMTNVFAVIAGVLVTPALDRCGVAGVTRDRIIDAVAKEGLTCEVRELAWRELADAQEAFLTNSLAGVWPVNALEGRALQVGAVTRALQRAIEGEDRAQAA